MILDRLFRSFVVKTSVLILGPRAEGWGYATAARSLGYRTIALLDRRGADVLEPRQRESVDQVVTVDAYDDEEELCALVDDLRFTRVLSAVIAGDETQAESAARLAGRHGLLSHSIKAARASVDRGSLLTSLTEAGMPRIPVFRTVQTPEGASEAGRAAGFPCVLRPVSRVAGDPVRVEDPDELDSAYDEAASAARRARVTGDVIVESYIPGPELTLVGHVAHGDFQPVAVAERRLGPDPYMQPLGWLVRPADQVPATRLTLWYVKTLAERLDVRFGVLRVHMRMQQDAPWLTGFGIGPGPDMLDELVRMTTGVNLAVADIALRTGGRVPQEPARFGAAGVSYIASARHAGRVYRRLGKWREITRIDGVLSTRVEIAPGELIPPRHDRSSRLARVVYAGGEYWQAGAVRSKLERAFTVI